MPKRRPLVSFTFYIRNCTHLLLTFSILLYIGCSTCKPRMMARTRKKKRRILRVIYSLSFNADTYLEVSIALQALLDEIHLSQLWLVFQPVRSPADEGPALPAAFSPPAPELEPTSNTPRTYKYVDSYILSCQQPILTRSQSTATQPDQIATLIYTLTMLPNQSDTASHLQSLPDLMQGRHGQTRRETQISGAADFPSNRFSADETRVSFGINIPRCVELTLLSDLRTRRLAFQSDLRRPDARKFLHYHSAMR